jgi:hypothetical protein
MPKNPTPAQSAASRANGARSRGPVTAEGLARCRRATVRHGLRGRFELLPGEDAAAFERLRAAWYRRLRPTNSEQAKLVEAQVELCWRRRRLDAIEDRLLRTLIAGEPGDGLPSLETVCRYRARLAGEQRALERAFAALEAKRARALRDGPEPLAPSLRSAGAPVRHDRPEAREPSAEVTRPESRLHDRPEQGGSATGPSGAEQPTSPRHDGPERSPRRGNEMTRSGPHDPGEAGRRSIGGWTTMPKAAWDDASPRHDRPEPGSLPAAFRGPRAGWLGGASFSALRLGLGDSGLWPFGWTLGAAPKPAQSGAVPSFRRSRW